MHELGGRMGRRKKVDKTTNRRKFAPLLSQHDNDGHLAAAKRSVVMI